MNLVSSTFLETSRSSLLFARYMESSIFAWIIYRLIGRVALVGLTVPTRASANLVFITQSGDFQLLQGNAAFLQFEVWSDLPFGVVFNPWTFQVHDLSISFMMDVSSLIIRSELN